jgi:hypothetical protein
MWTNHIMVYRQYVSVFDSKCTVILWSLTHFRSCHSRLKIPCFCQNNYLTWFIHLLWWVFSNVNKEVMDINSTWKRQLWKAHSNLEFRPALVLDTPLICVCSNQFSIFLWDILHQQTSNIYRAFCLIRILKNGCRHVQIRIYDFAVSRTGGWLYSCIQLSIRVYSIFIDWQHIIYRLTMFDPNTEVNANDQQFKQESNAWFADFLPLDSHHRWQTGIMMTWIM